MRLSCTTSRKTVGHPRVRGLAITPGAASFLIVAFDTFRQIQMGDEAHVGLIDAHAECNRRDHDDAVVAQKFILIAPPRFRVHAGVIGQRRDALAFEPMGGLVDFFARQTIDNAGVAGVFFAQKAQQLLARVLFFDNGITNVRPIETGNEDPRIFELEALDHFLARQFISGRRQRNARHVGKTFVQN